MARLFLAVLFCVSCGDSYYVEQCSGEWCGQMTTYPPDDHTMYTGTWGTDADLIESTVGSITAFADAGGGDVTVTSNGHSVMEDMYVRITGTTNYDGEYVVVNGSVTANTFDITVAWVADDATGLWHTNVSGDTFVLFDNTATTPIFYGLSTDKVVEVEEGMPYQVVGIVEADSVAAGNQIYIGAGWADADGDTIGSNSYVYSAELAAIGTWYQLSGVVTAPAGARYASALFAKVSGASAFHAGLDTLGIRPMPVAFEVYKSTNFVHDASPNLQKVEFNTEVFDYGSTYDSSTNYRFTATATGLYSLTARMGDASLPDACDLGIVLYKNGVQWKWGTRDTYASGDDAGLIVTAPGSYLTLGDYVEVYVYNTFDSVTFDAGQHVAYFHGSRVE